MSTHSCSPCEFACHPALKVVQLVRERLAKFDIKPLSVVVHNEQAIFTLKSVEDADFMLDDLCELVFEENAELQILGHMDIEQFANVLTISKACITDDYS